MGTVRRLLLHALPKTVLSRTTGALVRIPLPRLLRGVVYGWFSQRYGVDLSEVRGHLRDYRSLSDFFVRPLEEGARPVDPDAPLVWPCDGRIVASGPLRGGRIEQVKNHDYALAELLRVPALAARLENGSHATIYLAPRDYHRVHVPFDARLLGSVHTPGKLFPVNPGAVRSIFPLFAINERVTFRFELDDGRPAAVVMIAALNVGDIRVSLDSPCSVRKGDELGRFAFGSTTVVAVGPGGPQFPELAPETDVKVGAAVG